MSSYLFSPLCLDPLQGVIDFTNDIKPFRTKVVQAEVSIIFTDTLTLAVKEVLTTDIAELFHTHRDNCNPAPIPCVTDGFESEVFDDDLGFEPTIRYKTAEYSKDTAVTGDLNFIGFSAGGYPVFIVPELCIDPAVSCPDGFEMVEYDQSEFDYADPDCISTCNNVYAGSCTTVSAVCTDTSATTLAATFAENLLIEDSAGGLILDIAGSELFSPIYAYPTVSSTTPELVLTALQQVIYPG